MAATAELFSCLKAASAALPAAVGSQDTATTEGIISFSVVENFAKPCHSKRPLARDTVRGEAGKHSRGSVALVNQLLFQGSCCEIYWGSMALQ